MIILKEKKDCSGCHACLSACAHKAITMSADVEGFLYPTVNKEACIECGLCEQVCPVIHQAAPTRPTKVYAAKSKDEAIRQESSSGGIFILLADAVIREGGVVFGAKFDENWNVVHAAAENTDETVLFRGSKYVQSTIGTTYKEARNHLKRGRKVLFSGTPCQIAGLKRYLRKEYDNLLAVDVICHGVPSPLVWKRYLEEVRAKGAAIKDIAFRDKTHGWAQYAFRIRTGGQTLLLPPSKNPFMRGFLADLYLRPSCHACPTRCGKSGSDITLGDFWGIQAVHPEMDDNKGCSAIMIHTTRGQDLYDSIEKVDVESRYEYLLPENPSLEHNPKPTKYARRFWKRFDEQGLDCVFPICKQKASSSLLLQYLKIKRALLGLLKR